MRTYTFFSYDDVTDSAINAGFLSNKVGPIASATVMLHKSVNIACPECNARHLINTYTY